MRISDCSSDVCSSDLEIVVARQAVLLAGFDEDPRQRVDVAQVRDRERAVASVQVAGAAGIAFGAHETGQHAGPVPAVGALRGPVVVVAGDAADVAHRVRSEESRAGKSVYVRVDIGVRWTIKKTPKRTIHCSLN